MAKNPRSPRLWIIAGLLAGGIPAHAQDAPPPINPTISTLAVRISEPLQEAQATKVVVAEFLGPAGESHPIGKYLAEQLTASLQRNFPKLEVMDRPKQEMSPNNQIPERSHGIIENDRNWARKLGANVVIVGSFAKVSQGIGISLSAEFCNGPRKSLGLTTGLMAITDEITAISSEPIPSPADGIVTAGTCGTTLITCIYCPIPSYSPKAKAAKYQGTVVLQVVVTAQGRAERINVLKGPGLGLEEKSIEAVKKWKFKPATGPDGNPVAARVPIEVSFRLY